ncbi:MAG TPA: hypothetical protein VGM29_11625, partial [Polyangiaceae bacterium]
TGASRETPSTLRSIEVAEVVSPDPESLEQEGNEQPVYYEPQPLIAVSDHKTLEIDTVKLARDIDPRRLPTQLSMRPVSAAPLDSDWPQPEVVVVRSQPPSAGRRRWRAFGAWLLLLGAFVLLALVLVRAATRYWHSSTQAVSVGTPMEARAVVGAAALPSATSTVVAPAALAASATAAEASAAPTASASVEEARAPDEAPASVTPTPSAARSVAKSNPRHSTPTPNASSRVLAAPSVSKPKRAIY